MSLKNNPHYQNGIYIGSNMAKHIKHTTYKTIDVALEKKKELVKDLKEQFGWDETHKDIAEILGSIVSLEEALKIEEANKPEHKLSIDDVCNVADSIGIEVSAQQIIEILDEYDTAQENDPSATWNLVIEHLIHEKNNENL